MLRKIVRFVVIAAVLGFILLIGGGLALWRASQSVPDFYEQALVIEVPDLEEAGDELERQVLELHNDVQDSGQWRAEFTDDQINAWLAVDLPAKFPKATPAGVSDPRVAIADGQILAACRYDSPKLSSVVSLALTIQLTDEPNVIAIQIKNARAGAVPLPLKSILDKVASEARRTEVPVRWSQTDGDPVALVTIPDESDRYENRRIHITGIEFFEGRVVLTGETETTDRSGAVARQNGSIVNSVSR